MTLVSISVIYAMKKENSLILIIWVSCIETEIALVNQLIKMIVIKRLLRGIGFLELVFQIS